MNACPNWRRSPGHGKVFAVDPEIIRIKSLEANANPRKREVLVLHRDDADPLQRMLNALQPGSYTVLFEVKAGPFDPSGEKEFAPWAPAENAPEAPAYLESLEQLFTRRYLPDSGSR